MFGAFRKIITEKEHGFTLIELIVVIIIVAVLAAVGLNQYAAIVEKSRLAEAKVRIGTMRQLAHEYYMNNGTLTGITYVDLGVGDVCAASGFYRYYLSATSTFVQLLAYRCTTEGKAPNASRGYVYYLQYYPGSGQSDWHCAYSDDGSSCFGLSP